MEWRTIRVYANTYVVCCNAYLTPQVLYNSGLRPAPLGHYLTEQPMAFCQIVLRQDIVDGVAEDPRFADRVKAHREQDPRDPIPIPTLQRQIRLHLWDPDATLGFAAQLRVEVQYLGIRQPPRETEDGSCQVIRSDLKG